MKLVVAVNGRSLLGPLTGIGRYTHQVIDALAREPEVEVHVFYGPYWRRWQPAATSVDAKQVQARLPGGRWRPLIAQARHVTARMLPFARPLVRAVEARRFQQGWQACGAMVYHEPNLVPVPHDGPTVITLHDLSTLRFPQWHPHERVAHVGRQLERAVASASQVVTVSRLVREEVLARFEIAPERVHAIHNGVDARFVPAGEAEREVVRRLGLAPGGYLLHVGTLEPRKNLVRLMRAHAALPEALRARYPLVLAGMRGWLDDEIQTMLSRTPYVQAPGYVTDESLPALVACARGLAYPSLYEGFGLPVLEAMACGVPVLTSRGTAMAEFAPSSAILIDPHSEADLQQGLATLLQDEARRQRMCEDGPAIAAHMSWTAHARALLAVYRQCL